MLVIDRFEGEWAIIEFKSGTFKLPKDLLPQGIIEGDVINLSIQTDKKETEKRKKTINSLIDDLFI